MLLRGSTPRWSPAAYVVPDGSAISRCRVERSAGFPFEGRDELAVRPDPGRPGVVGDDHRVGDLPVGQGDREPRSGRGHGLAHLCGQVEGGGEVGPEAAVPVAVGGVEVARGVALPAVADPASAVGGELLVEQGRDGLVGGGPLRVAAAEDGVGQAGGRIGGGTPDPAAERGGVVGRGAVVGGADDQRGAVAGQVVDVVVERAEGDVEAAFGALLGQAGGDRLGGAEVGPEQHAERGAVPGDERGRRGLRDGDGPLRRGHRSGPVEVHVGTGVDLDVEAVGLHREGRLDLELVPQVVDELEALQQHAEHQRGLLQGELPPDAGPLPGAEGLVGVGRERGHPRRRRVVGVELRGVVAPHRRRVVQRLAQHEHRGVGGDRVAPADHGVLVRGAGEAGRGRPEPQRLVEDLPDVGEPLHLLERGRRGGAEHPVDLRSGLRQHVRVLQQVVERERQQPGGRLVAGDQEGDALGPDVLVRQPLAGLLVDAGEHPAQQVRGGTRVCPRTVEHGFPLGDDLVDQVVHERLVLLHLALCTDVQAGLDRQLPGTVLRVGETARHRLDERVLAVAVEGVEPVAETAEGDGVERQPGHVGRDVDLLARVQPRPLVHQLVGDVEHVGHVVAHRLQAERGHEDVVRAVPERVVRVRGEQPVARTALAEVPQAAPDQLVEPAVVADLVDEFRSREEHPDAVREVHLEDRPVLAGHPDEALDGACGVDVEEVPDHGQAVWAGKIVQGQGSGGHG